MTKKNKHRGVIFIITILMCLFPLIIFSLNSMLESEKIDNAFIDRDQVNFRDSPTIRVKILSRYHPESLTIQSENSKKIFKIRRSGKNLLVNGKKMSFFSTLQQGFSPGSIWRIQIPKLERSYQGSLEIRSHKRELEIINELNIEIYLRGVLAAEFAQASHEALKTQAVLSRTLAVYQIKNRQHKKYHLVDLTIDQAFNGFNRIRSIEQAIKETERKVVVSNGEVIIPFWHSTCAGKFYTPAQMWGGPELSYLVSDPDERDIPDDLCRNSTHFSWEKTSDFKTIQKIIYDNRKIIIKKGFPVLEENRIVLNDDGDYIYPEKFRLWVNRKLGWNFIKSNHLEIRHPDGEITFKGKGLGHNIGMCQCETQKLAELGQEYISILHHYYKNISIVDYRNM